MRSRLHDLLRGGWLVYVAGLFLCDPFFCVMAESRDPPELVEVDEVGESGSLEERF